MGLLTESLNPLAVHRPSQLAGLALPPRVRFDAAVRSIQMDACLEGKIDWARPKAAMERISRKIVSVCLVIL